MPRLVGKQKLRRLYQATFPPTTPARDAMRRTTFSIERSLEETDGSKSVYPFRGILQESPIMCMNLLPNLTERTMEAYQGLLALTALALVAGLVVGGGATGNVWAVLGLAVAAGLAERGRVKLGAYFESSISSLPTVFTAAVFGPLP